jgi:hypothetical protein
MGRLTRKACSYIDNLPRAQAGLSRLYSARTVSLNTKFVEESLAVPQHRGVEVFSEQAEEFG